jgi:hypothetical protein
MEIYEILGKVISRKATLGHVMPEYARFGHVRLG